MVTAALAAFGGKSAVSNAQEVGPQGIQSSPAQFDACATSALTNNPTTINNEMETGPAESPRRTEFVIRTGQYGLISKAEGDTDCIGMESVTTGLRITAGPFSQTVKNASTRINFDNSTFGEWNQVSATSSGSFSYKRACDFAKAEKKAGRKKERVRLIQHVTARYSEPGYPTVGQTENRFIQDLPCESIPPRPDPHTLRQGPVEHV